MGNHRRRKPSSFFLKGFAFIVLILALFISQWGQISEDIFSAFSNDSQSNSFGGEVWEVHYLDVGQGDCILINGPDGAILIDGGNPGDGDDIAKYLRQQGISNLHTVIATHPHSDHIGGLKDIVNTFPIKNIYMPDIQHNSSTFLNLLKVIEEKGYRIKEAKANIGLSVGSEIKAVFLGPVRKDYEDLNNFSAVLYLKIKNISFLFMGDAEKEAENDLKGEIKADILKVGHHGSDSSTGEDFLKRVNPSIAVISVGKINPYNHPDKEVINRLEKKEIKTYTTANDGTIVILTDGIRYKVVQ